MLGVTIRFDSYKNADDFLLRVIEVEENSPAELAGLQPMTDYLLGTAEKCFKDSEILYQTLSQYLEKPIEIYVYNSESDDVRIVVLMPSYQWKNSDDVGLLGASVASGYLHRLPSSTRNTNGK